MSKKSFFSLPLWDRYSKRMHNRLETLRAAGLFTPLDAEERKLRLSIGQKEYDGQKLALFFLVDQTDGVIADAKFQALGDSALLAMADLAVSFIIGKTYAQAERTSKDLLIKQFSEEKEAFAFPEELLEHVELILAAISEACHMCHDIPLEIRSPLGSDERKEGQSYPGFLTMSKEEKLHIIEEIMNVEIRPYVALDEGGVEILDLTDNAVTIAYKGNCTSCYSSVGSTLSAIQGILQEKVHPSLTVVPNMDNLKF